MNPLMTPEEFAVACLGPIEATYGSVDIFHARMLHSTLGDIPPELLAAATLKHIAESKWLPKPAEIRVAAMEIASEASGAAELSAGEAWGFALKAIRRIDYDIDGSVERARKLVPAMVWEAMQNVGVSTLVNAEGPIQTVQLQRLFHEAFNALVTRERKLLLAPPQVRQAIEEQRRNKALPPSETPVLRLIGAEK